MEPIEEEEVGMNQNGGDEEEDDTVGGVNKEEEDPEEEVDDEETEEDDDEEEEEEEEEGGAVGGADDEDELEGGVEGEDPLDEEPGGEGDGNPPSKKTRTKKSKVPISNISGIAELEANKNTPLHNSAFEEESDEEPEEDENYLQKFDSEMRDNFILNYHPEARTHNYEEVKALARVTRDGRGIIIDPMHKTLPFLTKYEMTRILGQRAKQLDSGAKAFVKVPLNVIDGYHIAKLELEQKKIPFIIKRPFPNGGIEYWHVSDLELL
jgi:DNA-directed RNA polymerase subunit K/omega